MAAKARLAGSFRASRLTLSVAPGELDRALECCRDVGLTPRLYGYQNARCLFRVLVPQETRDDFVRGIGYSCRVALLREIQTDLICPLS